MEEREGKSDYVRRQAAEAPAADARSAVLNRIRKTLVTSRLTLATERAGTDPYDSARGCGPGAVWGNRSR